MTQHLPVPCPTCGGLVDKQTLRCTRCRASWQSLTELLYDGLCGASERAHKIAGAQDWNTMTAAVQGMQDVQDTLALRKKYEVEIEKLERNDERSTFHEQYKRMGNASRFVRPA